VWRQKITLNGPGKGGPTGSGRRAGTQSWIAAPETDCRSRGSTTRRQPPQNGAPHPESGPRSGQTRASNRSKAPQVGPIAGCPTDSALQAAIRHATRHPDPDPRDRPDRHAHTVAKPGPETGCRAGSACAAVRPPQNLTTHPTPAKGQPLKPGPEQPLRWPDSRSFAHYPLTSRQRSNTRAADPLRSQEHPPDHPGRLTPRRGIRVAAPFSWSGWCESRVELARSRRDAEGALYSPQHDQHTHAAETAEPLALIRLRNHWPLSACGTTGPYPPAEPLALIRLRNHWPLSTS
jgi:hypothetical protein